MHMSSYPGPRQLSRAAWSSSASAASARASCRSILRHIGITPERITDRHGGRRRRSRSRPEYGIKLRQAAADARELQAACSSRCVGRGDFLLNLSVDVSSIALVKFCHEKGALYLDTCIEPWPGGYTDPTSRRRAAPTTRCARKRWRCATRKQRGPTAVLTHGANPGPGLALRQAGAAQHRRRHRRRRRRAGDARRVGGSSRRSSASRSSTSPSATRRSRTRRRSPASSSTRGRSTASSAKAVSRPSSAGARTRRTGRATASSHDFGRGSAIYLMQPGAGTRVRTWTPQAGHFHGFLITHGESISISDYLTHRARATRSCTGRRCTTRITRATTRCSRCTSSPGSNWRMQDRKRILMEEITKGIDELGVLLAGHKKNAYWYGSQLSIAGGAQARAAQQRDLAAGDRRGARRAWSGRSRTRTAGVVEPDEMDFQPHPRDLPAVPRARSSASTASGIRSSTAAGCSPKTSTRPIRGSSRTCA